MYENKNSYSNCKYSITAWSMVTAEKEEIVKYFEA